MDFNAEKCHVMKFRKSAKRPDWDYLLGSNTLQESNKEKDLGVIINNKLSPEDHINDKVTYVTYVKHVCKHIQPVSKYESGLCIYR